MAALAGGIDLPGPHTDKFGVRNHTFRDQMVHATKYSTYIHRLS